MPNDPNIWTLVVSTLLGGGVLGALINQFFLRAKTRAEAMKTEAEAERTKAETARILAEIKPAAPAIAKGSRKEPKGWFKAGAAPADYDIGIDLNETLRGKPVCYLKSRPSPQGFGTAMQMFKANSYLGKRVMLTGMAKSDAVEEWAAFWMRVDGRDGKTASFDNMQDRPIRGSTGWTKYQIVLDVPEDSAYVALGLLLGGTGQVWMAEVQLAVVSSNTPTTDLKTDYPDGPVNLSFEE